MTQTIVIIPCYNEEQRLDTRAYLDFFQAQKALTALFINDGSTDGTRQVLEELTKGRDQMEVLNFEVNMGKAGAVRQGVLQALKSNPDYVCFFDADLATPLDVIPKFVSRAREDNYDIVIGSRIKLLGRQIKRGFIRSSLGRLFAWLVSRMMKHPVYDTQCGAKLFKGELAGNLFAKDFVSKWFFDVELLRRYDRLINKQGMDYKLYEFPLQSWTEMGDSRLTFKDYLKTPWELFKIFRN